MLQLRPPSVSSRSNTVTSTCCCCKKKLAAPPPIPPPMIATRLVLAVCACAASTHREKHAAVRTPRRAMPVMCGQEHVLANCTPIRLRLQICTRSCSNKHRDTWRVGGWVLHQPPWSFGFDSQSRGTRENRRTVTHPVLKYRVPHGSQPRHG